MNRGEIKDEVAFRFPLSTKCQVPSAKCQVPSAKCYVLCAKCQVPCAMCQSVIHKPTKSLTKGEVSSISAQILQHAEEIEGQQFQFRHNHELSAILSGKTVHAVEVCEVASKDLSPVALRLCIRFTDGSRLEVDRRSTALPRAKRKVLHLDLAWQSSKR
ncbi:MAG: hypothetical protein DDT38_01234 [Firmicutes bacterium]|nr:hypothetical protein [candidate division NPL-UPA2 bacterium]